MRRMFERQMLSHMPFSHHICQPESRMFLLWTSNKHFSTVLMSVCVEYVTDMERIQTQQVTFSLFLLYGAFLLRMLLLVTATMIHCRDD